MPRLSHVQEVARQQIAQLAGSGLLPEELGNQILHALLLAIPADHTVIFGVDPDSLLFNRLIAITGSQADLMFYWLRHVYLVGEPTMESTYPGLMAANIRAVLYRDRLEQVWGMPNSFLGSFTPRQYHRMYHDIGTPSGGVLRAWYELEGRKFAALQMVRLDADHPFQAGDGHFLQLLVPMISRTLGAALSREEAVTSLSSGPAATGMLVLSPEGRITLQTPAAESWLEVLPDFSKMASVGTKLPMVIWSATAALRARMAEGEVYAALRVPTRYGPLRVEASPAGEDGTVAIALLPERPPAPPQLPQSWELTQQERKVLSLVAHGLTNRQIASALVVTENTVESHLAHAYEKLAVSSRAQFLALLFQAAYWPLRCPE